MALINQREVACKEKQIYEQHINDINIKLVKVCPEQSKLKHNITENKNALITLKTNG